MDWRAHLAVWAVLIGVWVLASIGIKIADNMGAVAAIAVTLGLFGLVMAVIVRAAR